MTTTNPPERPKRAAGNGSPRRRGYLVVAAVVVALAVGAVIFAAHSNPPATAVDVTHLPDKGPAPVFEAKAWINSPPLTASELKGKVVLYDFWTYSCINCQRTFPYIRAWFDRYSADGLVIIGIHSPEFDFEKVQKNVEAAVKRDDVTWPVALDSNMAIWNKFQNNSWPADYIADKTGEIRYTSVGEGMYSQTEDVIRELLGVAKNSPRADFKVTKADATSKQNSNPETYLGLQYQDPTQPLIEIQGGSHDYPPSGAATVAAPRISSDGEISLVPGKLEGALVGQWTASNEAVTSDAAASTILLGVHAKEVNLVMATESGKPIDAVVELDGHPVPAADRGSSLHVDGNGRTVVTVQASDMYRLLLNATVANHVLSISAAAPGLEAFDFTFGQVTVLGQIVALFGAGVASFLAPCIIPLVPAYLGIIVGEMGDAHDPARAVPATLIFIAGFTTVFAGLGAIAGALGSSLSTFQSGVRTVGGIVIIVMGLALLGVARGPLSRERRLIPTLPKVTGVARPYVIGVAFGAGWSPCVGPLLAAALTIAARGGEVGRGTILLCAYAMGIGVPFLVAALGLASSPRLADRLRRLGPGLERVSGALLVVLGVLLATNTYIHLTSYLARFVPAVHGL